MKLARWAWVAVAVLLALPAAAEQRVTLGWGRMFSNDAIGDGNDRWRTGGYQVSRMRGYSWGGTLPQAPGELLEFRAASQIIAPRSLRNPAPGDRRYAAMLSFGLHSQFDWRGNDVSLGGDLVILGPQTGISNFQNWVHKLLKMDRVDVAKGQIGAGFHPTAVLEVGRRFSLGSHVQVRPFAETQVGVESLVRAGGDMVIGSLGRDDVMVRDAVTGQRYRAVEGTRDQGLSFVLGGDIARVFDSALLPAGGAAVMSDSRQRLRAGVHWQGEKASAFYGVSFIGPEFEAQGEGQLVGSLNLNLRF